MELQQLLHFRELGIPISDKSILRAAFITNKKQIMKEMEEQTEQQNQQQQAQQQQQDKKDNAEVMLKFANSRSALAREKDLMASAQERIAKINDINATAELKNMESDLNLVKLAMELEDVQFNQLRTAFELAQTMKMAQQQPQGVINEGSQGGNEIPKNAERAI